MDELLSAPSLFKRSFEFGVDSRISLVLTEGCSSEKGGSADGSTEGSVDGIAEGSADVNDDGSAEESVGGSADESFSDSRRSDLSVSGKGLVEEGFPGL